MSWQKYLPSNGYWTGRSNLYKDDKKVDYVINELSGISSNTVENGRKNVQSAVHELSQTLVNTEISIPDNALDSYFDGINEVILGGEESTGVINLINQKKESADDYAKQTEEHPFLTGFATGGMVLSKFGEGFVSAFEAVVVDCPVAIVGGGFTTLFDKIAGTHTNDAVADFVEKDYSGMAFGTLNDATGISKYSLITSDSGLSNLCKGAGVATGYLVMGGLASGYAAGASNATTITKFLASSTNSNTIIAGLGGIGSGTQNSLRRGNTFATAIKDGFIQGGEQALTAYAMGKLGEHIEKGRQTKLAESKAEFYENEYKNASSELEKATNPENGYTNGMIDQAKNKFETTMTNKVNAQTELDNIKSTKIGISGSTDFQGFNDPVSRLSREEGEHLATNGIKNTINESWNQFRTDISGATLGETGKNILKEGKDIVLTPIKTVAAETKHGVATIGINGVANAETVARDIIGIGAAYNSAAEDTKANQMFQARKNLEDSTDKVKDTKVKVEKDTPVPTPNPNPAPDPTPDPNPSPSPNPTPDTNKDNSVTPSTPSNASDTPTTKDPITPTAKDPTTSITTPPSNTGNGNEATTGSTNTIHTGGGYTGTNGYTSSPSGYTPGQSNTTGNMTDGTIDGTTGTDSSLTGALTEGTTSIEDVIKGSKVTKIPTSPSPVTTTSSSSGSSAVIPIAAGLSAAAGIGAKAYMDRKHNNDNGEDDEDEFDTDEWSGDDSVDIQYDEDTANGENYLDDDDDYSYQATSNNEEKYDARSSEELADLQ